MKTSSAGQRLHRDQLDRPPEPDREHQHPHPVQHRRGPGPAARPHVRGAAHDHPGQRQPAQRTGHHVRHALPGQLLVQVGARPGAAVDRHRAEQRLHPGQQRHQQHRRHDHMAVALRPHRERPLVEGAGQVDPGDVPAERPGASPRRPAARPAARGTALTGLGSRTQTASTAIVSRPNRDLVTVQLGELARQLHQVWPAPNAAGCRRAPRAAATARSTAPTPASMPWTTAGETASAALAARKTPSSSCTAPGQ